MQICLLLSVLLTACAVNVMADDQVALGPTKHCSNGGTIDKDNETWVKKGCDPATSAGVKSAHNCKSGNGKYYLCKQGSTWTCSAVKNMVGLENGECFK
ncbi:uncharacterized protein BT62DRAFT_928649 [Guyanagaster necrorhizus]|uniref:Uncharacterized protein n=1 Tax=Guyanagaster necrorhizus TaxID=856835 RepID=A0A9P7VZ85_9AGAR|nr:uncharacterized protein BT62DRAFT_928649 [Guyanagaster necrorhizus MCA 3950]KAG7449893.1 hypothetical protein BT62DRAFT_928649 [Guyanagaster necrorhizus MCA 3950]